MEWLITCLHICIWYVRLKKRGYFSEVGILLLNVSHLLFSITSHLYVKLEEYLIMFQSSTSSRTFCSDGIFCISVVLYVTAGYLWLLSIWTVTSVWGTKLLYYILVNLNLNSSRYLVTTILDCTSLDQSIQIFLSFFFFKCSGFKLW